MADGGIETLIPTPEDAELAGMASRALAAAQPKDDLRVRLDDGQELVLPRGAARLLSHLLTEMARGNAVTLIPIHAELTTQEAADMLNVSRPYLIRLLEEGKIPFHKAGTHRRVKFTDLQSFRTKVEAERQAAMDELARQAQELELEMETERGIEH